jgi:hypothetical protein
MDALMASDLFLDMPISVASGTVEMYIQFAMDYVIRLLSVPASPGNHHVADTAHCYEQRAFWQQVNDHEFLANNHP